MVASDIFFLPSKWEGISLSIYEAMACGLPIVGANVGGQKELLTPECGILVSPSDEETEAREYSELLYRLIVDPNYRAKLGNAGRERVVNFFRLDQMGERMVGVLENAIKFNRTHPSQELSKNLARVLASQAVDYANLSQKATHLSFSNESLNLRLKIFLVVKRLSEPFFLWGVDRGWTWLFPLSERVKRILLPKI
jgi:hypothetical protein